MSEIFTSRAIGLKTAATLLFALALTMVGCQGVGTSYGGGGGNPPPASITSVTPTSGTVGTPVTIAGANFGATQSASTVKFNGTSATPTSWSATSIVAPVPSGATTGNVVVTVGGVGSNGVNFTVTTATAPSITSLSTTSGAVGTSVTISGANFGATQGTSTIKFNGVTATPTSWTATSIVAPVPAGATTGNVVVTVAGVASNGVTFTVPTAAAPSITSLNPTSGAVGTSVTITGANFGATQGSNTVKFNGTTATPTSWSATSIVAPVPTGATTGNVVVAVGGVASNGMTFTVSTSSSMGPLKQSTVNSRYFVDTNGRTVFLSGFHTWDDFQDTQPGTPASFNFMQYVAALVADGENATILWAKDMPRLCQWKESQNWNLVPLPWPRTGSGNASDGLPKFDLSQFNQAYFDRMLSEVQTLNSNGIYAIVQLFDGLDVASYRCATDGMPFTGSNNINGVDDGYSGGGISGVGAFTMTTNNAVTAIQDAYVKKMLDTLNAQPNVLYEIAEEQPGTAFSGTPGYGGASSMTFWAAHMFGLIHTYEKGGTFEGTTYPGLAFQHPVGIGSMNFNDRNSPEGDAVVYASAADWVAPSVNAGVDSFPAAVSTNNQGKVAFNDIDHSISSAAFVNSSTGAVDDVSLRWLIGANYTNGASAVLFMDPFEFYLPTNQRNPCASPSNSVCPNPMTKYDPFRKAIGYVQVMEARLVNKSLMTPQGTLCSTGMCLVNNAATGSEFVVYSKAAASFTVDLTAQANRTINVEWLDPTTGTVTAGSAVNGGSTHTFSAPWGNSHDAVLHLTDGG